MLAITCQRARSMMSVYLDGVVTGTQMQSMAAHLRACRECTLEYSRLQQTQRLLAGLGRQKAPPELALEIRVALSQAANERALRRLDMVAMRLRDALNAFMLPATAGVVSAVLCFGLLIGVLVLPERLAASRDDVPTMLFTPPQLQAMPADVAISTDITDDGVVVETFVDAKGRVQDYRILSAPENGAKLRPQLNNIMIFTTFRPATSFGIPTSGRAVLSFSNIHVKG